MDGEIILAYIAQVLVPTLTLGDTVTMDNLSAHKMAGVRLAIESAGANPLHLPALLARSQSNRDGIFQAQSHPARRCAAKP